MERPILHISAAKRQEGIRNPSIIRGIVLYEPIGALAHLQVGRTFALQGDTAKACGAYKGFLTLWKDADPDNDSPRLNRQLLTHHGQRRVGFCPSHEQLFHNLIKEGLPASGSNFSRS